MAITTAQIHAAADQIDKEGKRPTLAGVRTVLGGGSFSTIQEAMKSWSRKADDEEATAEPVPQDVADEAERFTAALWQLAEKHAAEHWESERVAYETTIKKGAEAYDDAVNAADEQAQRVEEYSLKYAELLGDRDATIYKLVEAERRASEHHQAQLLAEGLAEERAKTIKTLEHLLAKMKPTKPEAK